MNVFDIEIFSKGIINLGNHFTSIQYMGNNTYKQDVMPQRCKPCTHSEVIVRTCIHYYIYKIKFFWMIWYIIGRKTINIDSNNKKNRSETTII